MSDVPVRIWRSLSEGVTDSVVVAIAVVMVSVPSVSYKKTGSHIARGHDYLKLPQLTPPAGDIRLV